MLVNQIMNDKPPATTPHTPISEALKLMAKHKERHLIVMGNNKSVVGILSDRDISVRYNPDNHTSDKWDHITTGECMTPWPFTIGSLAPVKEAAKIMLKEAVSALPVVDNGALVGLLSDRDFTRYFARKQN